MRRKNVGWPIQGRTRGVDTKASVLILSIIIVAVLGIIIGATISFASFQYRMATRSEIYQREFEAAEYAVSKLYAELKFLIDFGATDLDAAVQSITVPQLADVSYLNSDYINLVFEGEKLVEKGTCKGMTLYHRIYRLKVRAKATDPTAARFNHPGVLITQDVEIGYVPLYYYIIFSNPNWELIPGPTFNASGRVHGNKDFVFDAGAGGAYFHSYVTVAGKILHGAHHVPGRSDDNGPVYFTYDDGNNFRMMQQDGIWWDNTQTNWRDKALEYWDTYVRDEAHEIDPILPPIPPDEDPHALIERADPGSDSISMKDLKFEYLAGLKILRTEAGDLIGYDSEGTEVPLSYPDPVIPENTKWVYSESTFYNNREQQWIKTLDIDIFNLIESGIAPLNGILYVSEEPVIADPIYGDMQPAVRLKNGTSLPVNPTGGFTVASDDPVYIWGDYNVTEQKKALVAGDSINILSNSWDDSQNTQEIRGIQLPDALATTTDAIFLAGITPTSDAFQFPFSYSGGCENFFRYLENWSGQTHTIHGSIICMFESHTAVGRWFAGYHAARGHNYQPPTRDWQWTTQLGGGGDPPGIPKFYYIVRKGWNVATEYGGS